jgi:hypothetical protein
MTLDTYQPAVVPHFWLRSDTVSSTRYGPSSYRAAPLGIERLPLLRLGSDGFFFFMVLSLSSHLPRTSTDAAKTAHAHTCTSHRITPAGRSAAKVTDKSRPEEMRTWIG